MIQNMHCLPKCAPIYDSRFYNNAEETNEKCSDHLVLAHLFENPNDTRIRKCEIPLGRANVFASYN